MSAIRKDGGAAFPLAPSAPFQSGDAATGMSLRDYFAAKAMHAELLSAGSYEQPALDLADAAQAEGRTIERQIAHNAYLLADAMLAERSKR